MSEPKFCEVRRQRTGRSKPGTVTCYLDMVGRATLAELLDHLGNVAGSVPSGDITLNTGIIIWEEPARSPDLERWAEWDGAQRARHEKWERETYAKLRAKFEGGGGA